MSSEEPPVIAVDGPSGVGKTSVSRGVADALGWAHLDTGAYYRAATVVALVNGVDTSDEAAVVPALRAVEISYDDGAITVAGIDMSGPIRSDIITAEVSAVAAMATVRSHLVDIQRLWVADRGSSVVEGRDIGTVVFADAPLKIYLTARPEIRAARRAGETDPSAIERIARELAERDGKDSSRAASPLEQAADAVRIDTSDLTQDAVIATVLDLAAERGIAAAMAG